MDYVKKELEPERMDYAVYKLDSLVRIEYISDNEIQFYWKDELVKFFPYTGWHSGKSIKDGRGIHRLLKQLK